MFNNNNNHNLVFVNLSRFDLVREKLLMNNDRKNINNDYYSNNSKTNF